MSKRQSRQGFLGPDAEVVIADTEATIVGLCGGGSHVAQQLAHIGVKHFNLVDFDQVENHNANRMVGLSWREAERSDLKVDVISRRILEINPEAQIRAYPKRWEEVCDSLKFSSVIFGCVDSYRVRDELEKYARRYLIPYIDIGMDVHGEEGRYSISGQVIMSIPGGHCMRCFGYITDERITEEANRYGKAGGRPQVIWPNGTLASTAVGKFMQMILPWSQHDISQSCYMEYDGNRFTLAPSNRITALSGRECPHFAVGSVIGDIRWD